jgi:hypothetical protein
MATIDRGHSGWMLSFHTTKGEAHSAYGDLSDDERAELAALVSDKYHELMAWWSAHGGSQQLAQERKGEGGRPQQERAAE